MKDLNKWYQLLFILLLFILINVSLYSNPNSEKLPEQSLKIVFINDGHVAPYHVAWLSGFEEAIKEYNEAFKDVNISGYWLSASGDLETMIEQTETAMKDEVDILFVNAIQTEAFEPLVEKAQSQGIVWVAVHSPMESADYSFTLGDFNNGYNEGLALGAYFKGNAKIAIMLGQQGKPDGEARRDGIIQGISQYQNIEILAEAHADWDSIKAQVYAELWLSQYPELNAIVGVTDAYLYPSITTAKNRGNSDITFWGYDGDIPILEEMQQGQVKGDILLSGTREGWNFVQMAYKIHQGIELEKVYDFYTPLVLTEKTYQIILENGFPPEIEVFMVEDALELATYGHIEFGPDTVK